jgi:fumarate reductase flavoprotein subunit
MDIDNKLDYEFGTALIHPRDIKEELSSDIVVIGAGISGLTAALSAASQGTKTIILEKGDSIHWRGGHNAAIASRIQKQQGIHIDREQIIYSIMEQGGYRCDQRVVTAWADNCSSVMDWLIDMAKAEGLDILLDPTTKPWYFPNYPTPHVFWTSLQDFPKGQEALAKMLLKNALKAGVEVRYNTPALKLLRDGPNRVSGVIAKNPQGGFFRFNASKAVILCTGDYGHNPEMIKKYCWPEISKLNTQYDPPVNTGDGHLMGMSVGAAIDDPPHCVITQDWCAWNKDIMFHLSRQPWLYVNLKGERFMNEDLPYGYACSQVLRQPGGFWWSVWDSKWESEYPKMQSQCCKNMGPPRYMWDPKRLDHALQREDVLFASTIDELAQKIKVPVETFKATVERYSELARSGRDVDFGKHPDRVTTIEKPPYFACKMEVRFLVILSGLKINNKMQVLDKDGNIIPGLYAAGNASGSFFGHQYPSTIPGLTHSRAWTFGRLAGLNAAAKTD